MKMRFLVLFSLALCVANVYADIPAGYYNKAVGKKNAELKTAMHEIIKPHTRIDYGAKGTWVVFRSSDVRSNGAIWDMYSDVVRYFPESGSHPEMHIEHSVPKSWWGEESTFIYEASFDLHHLVPSDASANMSKSNRMLGVVETVTFDNGVTKTGRTTIGDKTFSVFEPHDDYKGDFARMYMYVVTCYQDYTWMSEGVNMFNTEAYPTLNEYAQDLLMTWHRQDPVSAKEINRNEVVYEAQNNRNPFIDFPLLAEYLWGDSIDCTFTAEVSEMPYLLTPSRGEKVDMGTVMTGSSLIHKLYVEGANLTKNLTLSWRNNAGIALSTNTLSAQQAITGANVELRYTNVNHVGMLRDTLIISGGGLMQEVELPVELQGTSSFIPLAPVDVTSTGAMLRWVAVPDAQSYQVQLYEGASAATDLFISAYVEGSSYNKAIALYNGTGRSINLSDYALGRQHNGAGEFVDYWKLPNTTLKTGETYILVNSQCDNDELRGYADKLVPSMETSPINFNGNDAIALYHHQILIDVVGLYGEAENWGKDMTLYRSYNTLGPSINYDVAQWEQAPQDDFARLRSHRMTGVTNNPRLIIDTLTAGTQLWVGDLLPTTIYTYNVTAHLDGREQAAIYACAFTTNSLAVPVDLCAQEITYNSIVCAWSEIDDAAGYEVQCYTLQGTESVTVSEGFDAVGSKGNPLPEGWTGTASGNYTSTASSGASAPSVSLKNTGEYIETPRYDAPITAMSFMYRFASTATGSSLLVEYDKGGEWQTLQEIEYVNTTKKTLDYSFDAADNVRAFRFTYTKVSGNMAIDDVVVTYGALEKVYVEDDMYVAESQATIINLHPNTTYYISVRSVLGYSYSQWSDAVAITTDKLPSEVSHIEASDIRFSINNDVLCLYNLPCDATVSVYDMQGMLCYHKDVEDDTLVVKMPSNGVFLIKIVNSENIFVQKVVV